ncbi:MAG: hypothetical protein RQ745_05810 [Longimicrobiales bacterium]|nr:hypothetical protein [Longimicrobiales bacterium]
MDTRIHILVREADKARYGDQAEREGKSLGAWLREAAEEKLAAVESRRFKTVEELRAFFGACDEGDAGREPEWAEHRSVIERSRRGSTEVT